MKRYLLFAGDMYYPCGGWEDFKDDFDTVEEAREGVRSLRRNPWGGPDWWDIIDTKAMKRVASSWER